MQKETNKQKNTPYSLRNWPAGLFADLYTKVSSPDIFSLEILPGFGDLVFAFHIWLSILLNLSCGLPAKPLVFTHSLAIPAGFASSRLLLNWKTCYFKDFALLMYLNPFCLAFRQWKIHRDPLTLHAVVHPLSFVDLGY